MWLLTACQPYDLYPVEWSFPILGTFSYKGFFDLEMLKKEKAKYDQLGYDTHVREVNGWSTLGILNDPILSNMLNRSTSSLANVIIHELTHGTLFIRDDIQYNENLASFVADVGTERFMRYKFGETSEEYQKYANSAPDYQQFAAYVLNGAQQLQALYVSFEQQQLSQEEKETQKQAWINQFTTSIDSVSFYNKNYYAYFGNFKPNNNFFLSYIRYRATLNQFQQEFEEDFQGDFPKYMAYLKEQYPSLF